MFGHAAFHSSHFGGKAGQKMILGGGIIKNRYRRQNAKSIRRQKQYMFGVTGFGYRADDIVDMVDRVRHPGIQRQAGIAEINFAVGINHHIFEQRIAANRPVNFRFIGFIEVACFGVAATLKVENTVIVPAMFIITNQAAISGG